SESRSAVGLLHYRPVLFSQWEAREASGSQTARFDHAARRRGGCVAAVGAGSILHKNLSSAHTGRRGFRTLGVIRCVVSSVHKRTSGPTVPIKRPGWMFRLTQAIPRSKRFGVPFSRTT